MPFGDRPSGSQRELNAGRPINQKIKAVKFYQKRQWPAKYRPQPQKMHLRKARENGGYTVQSLWVRFIDLRFIFIASHAEINEPSMAAGQEVTPRRCVGFMECSDGPWANKWTLDRSGR